MKHLSPEIQRSIKQLQIKTKRMLRSSQASERLTPLRGAGFEFDQLRDYSPGDDIRYMDWNAYARINSLMVKQYKEERSRSIVLAMDISKSTTFGTAQSIKRSYNNTVMALLSLVAHYSGDVISLVQFSNTIEKFIPFNHNSLHMHKLLESIYCSESTQSGTSLTILANFLKRLKRKSVIILVSDFIDQTEFSSSFKHIAQKHELIAIRITDLAELILPNIGFIELQDTETGEIAELDTRNSSLLASQLMERLALQKKNLQKIGAKVVDLTSNKTSLDIFIKLFCKQMRY